MTIEEAKLQIEYRKDFATPAQIEALNMALNALDEVEKYKKAIEDIESDIKTVRDEVLHTLEAFTPNEVLNIIDHINTLIDQHLKGVSECSEENKNR